MNARYFILAMLLMPMIFGCSKDNKTEKQIVGDWFMCYSKVCDSSADYEEEDTYTKETTNMFVSFYNDGNMKSSTNPDLGGSEQYVVNGTWSIEDGTLIMTHPEDGSESYSISFENDNLFYLNTSEGTYSQTIGYQRM